MLKALQNPDFARLFLANFISEIGTQIYRIAIPVWAYSATGSAVVAAGVLSAQFAAKLLVTPLLSPLADIYDRKTLMVASEALSGVAVALLPLFFMQNPAGWIFVAFLVGTMQSLGDPAVSAVIPDLVSNEDLDAANSLIMLPQRSLEMVFLGLAGVLVAWLGARTAFWIDAVSFGLSALVLLGMRSLPGHGDPAGGYWKMVVAGVRYILANPVTRYVIGVLAPVAMFGALDATVPPVLATQVFAAGDAKLGSMYYGFMEAFFAVGAVLGLFLAPRVSSAFSRRAAFLGGIAFFGVVEVSIGLSPYLIAVLILLSLLGVANQIFLVPARSMLQEGIDPEFMGRAMSAWGAIMSGSALVGMMLGGFLAQYLGPFRAFLVGGLGVLAMAAFGWLRNAGRG
ncbi:MFS transporter [Oceanithermus sp.]